MSNTLGKTFGILINLAFVFFVCTILAVGYICYQLFKPAQLVYESKTKPVITWELKGNGQKIDTVWICTINK